MNRAGAVRPTKRCTTGKLRKRVRFCCKALCGGSVARADGRATSVPDGLCIVLTLCPLSLRPASALQRDTRAAAPRHRPPRAVLDCPYNVYGIRLHARDKGGQHLIHTPAHVAVYVEWNVKQLSDACGCAMRHSERLSWKAVLLLSNGASRQRTFASVPLWWLRRRRLLPYCRHLRRAVHKPHPVRRRGGRAHPGHADAQGSWKALPAFVGCSDSIVACDATEAPSTAC